MTTPIRTPHEFREVRRLLREAGAEMLAELAVARGFIAADQLAAAVRDADAAGRELTAWLVDRGLLTREQLDELRSLRDRRALDGLLAADGATPYPEEVANAQADPARVVDRYVLAQPIGRGGGGTVWKAWDTLLRRWVALKRPREEISPTQRQRFMREARVAASLRHPHLVAIYDAGEFQNRPYLVMELVDGRPPDPSGDPRRIAELLRKVARALDEAHRHGVVHRDIKPDNILIDERGDPHVVDFGLAHLSGVGLTQTGAVMGTPLYMAPEQVRAEASRIGPATDVYGLGAVLYELLTGRPPHDGRTAAEVYDHVLREDPTPLRHLNARLPAELEAICMKAIEREPEHRYATAGALAADLEAYLEGRPVLARVPTLLQRWTKRVRRHPALWGLGALTAIAVAVAAIALLRAGRLEEAAWASHLSATYASTALETSAAMRRLEDHWHGGATREEADDALRRVDAVVQRVSARYPTIALPRAWRGLAVLYAGREKEGLDEIQAACAAAGDDPFPHVIAARAQWALYARGAVPDLIYDLHGREIGIVSFAETASMRTAREAASVSLGRALGMKVWGKLTHGREYEEYAEATLLLARGEHARAADGLERLRADPVLDGEAMMLRALALLQSGRIGEAAAAWERLGHRGWPDARYFAAMTRLKRAVDHRGNGADPSTDLAAAVAHADAILANDPLHTRARLVRLLANLWGGQADAQSGRDPKARFEAAIADIDELLRQTGRSLTTGKIEATAHFLIALTERDLGRDPTRHLEQAIAGYGAIIRAEPSSKAYSIRSTCHSEKGLAEARFGRDPDESFRRAIEDADRAIELGDTAADVLVNRGISRAGLGDARRARGEDPTAEYGMAVSDYSEALGKSPDNVNAYHDRALAHHSMALAEEAAGRDPFTTFARAIADFDAAISRVAAAGYFKDRLGTYLKKGEAEIRRGINPLASFEQAVADGTRAIELQPAEAEFYRARAIARVHRGDAQRWLGNDPLPDQEKALEDLAAAERVRNDYWPAITSRGMLLQAMGRRGEAIAAYRRSLSVHADQPDVKARLDRLVAEEK